MVNAPKNIIFFNGYSDITFHVNICNLEPAQHKPQGPHELNHFHHD